MSNRTSLMSTSTNGTAAEAFPASRPVPSHRTGESLRIAAIDVGSNSIHMIVAQIDPDGGVTTLWRMKEPTGLGRMTFPSRRINAESMSRALTTLARFKHAAQSKDAEKIVAVATSAVREAANGGDLLKRAWRDLRLRVRVVSAKEEARLIYLGARHGGAFGDVADEPRLLVDIGGGSVEFIVGTNERPMTLESRKLGAARMTARFVKSDPPTKDELAALREHYRGELKEMVATSIRPAAPTAVVGTSGTLENIAGMCGFLDKGKAADGAKVVTSKRLDKLVSTLSKQTGDERALVPGLDAQRKDQIIAGVVLVQELFASLEEAGLDGLDTIEVCGSALREGILVDYVERKLPRMRIRREVPDPRRRSVLDLCRRSEWHKEHSEQVTTLTLRLFDELSRLHGLGPIDRELIEYAALMHDIGWHIGGKGHHKHSAYLIRHGRLKGFREEEVEVMANIARYHRKKPPKKSHADYAALPGRARRTVDVGAALLRIGDGLDRSHSAVVRDLRAKATTKRVKVALDTRADAQLEVWGASRKAELFEKVFERSIEFETA